MTNFADLKSKMAEKRPCLIDFTLQLLTHSRQHSQYIHVSVDGTFSKMYFDVT